jgi:hypothetical protein
VILLDRNLKPVEFKLTRGNGRTQTLVVGTAGKAVIERNVAVVVELGLGGEG